MGRLIDKLWENEFEFADYFNSETEELFKLFNSTRKELEKSLSDEPKVLFEDFLEYLGKYHDLMEKKAFSDGFSVGMQLASEAYVESEKLAY
ncbi:MAG: hypothetical protein E7586_05285 [Ruminococcaceae bacterium]|nr:hypothetical protein [Oscillospiraceae bacterium]